MGWGGKLGLAAIVCWFAFGALGVWAANCTVVQAHAPTAAEAAFLSADYDKAVSLYRAALKETPDDAELTAGLVRVLLREQKTQEAADTVEAALKTNANSAALLTAKAEVEYRDGTPWEAPGAIALALKADPCLPRAHLVLARVARLTSRYAVAKSQILLAHQLDPSDPDIRGEWIWTLPTRERMAELEKYMADKTGDDAEEKHREELGLERMKKQLSEPHKACRLTSTATSTEIPFVALLYDATHIRAFGLEVKLNHHSSQLQIDTGAGGLLVSRSVAQHAGLTPFSEAVIGGVGDKEDDKGYSAFADSIQIGNLEFHDCAVGVVANKRFPDGDGLIGMDVFSKFLVTLNYPGRRLKLDPLPPRPGEAATAPKLGTGDTDDDEGPAKGASGADAAAGKPTAAKANPAVAEAKNGPFDRYIAPEMKDYTPVYRVGHGLMLPVALNQSKLKLFILDTGAWATLISPGAAREVTKVYADDSFHVRGLNGEVQKTFSADEVTFAFAHVAQKIRDVPSFDTSKLSKDFGLEISGLLGARTLSLTTIHIDYRDGLVKFDFDPKTVPTVP